jgi:hypothetical protein
MPRFCKLDEIVYVSMYSFLNGYVDMVKLPKALEEYYVSGKVVKVYSNKATIYWENLKEHHVVDKNWWESSLLKANDLKGKFNIDYKTYRDGLVHVNKRKEDIQSLNESDQEDLWSQQRKREVENSNLDETLRNVGALKGAESGEHLSREDKKVLICRKKTVIARRKKQSKSEILVKHDRSENSYYCKDVEFQSKKKLRTENATLMKRDKHVVVPFKNKSLRCVFPGCVKTSTKPTFQCFRCQVPLCIAISACDSKLDSCFYLYHTVKKLKTAKSLGDGTLESLDDHRISSDSE